MAEDERRRGDRGPGWWAAPVAASLSVLALVLGVSVLASLGDTVAPGPDVDQRRLRPSPVGGRTVPLLEGEDRTGTAPRSGEVIIEGYEATGRTLTVTYTVRADDCLGRVRAVRVTQSTRAVSLRLEPVVAARTKGGRACPSLVLTDSLDLALRRPLGQRLVRDDTRRGALVPPL